MKEALLSIFSDPAEALKCYMGLKHCELWAKNAATRCGGFDIRRYVELHCLLALCQGSAPQVAYTDSNTPALSFFSRIIGLFCLSIWDHLPLTRKYQPVQIILSHSMPAVTTYATYSRALLCHLIHASRGSLHDGGNWEARQ